MTILEVSAIITIVLTALALGFTIGQKCKK